MKKNDYRHNPSCHLLENRLWNESLLPSRSEELTAISLDRYYGPRKIERLKWHPFWEIGCIVRGKTELVCKEDILLCADSVFVIPPNIPHAERSAESADIIWLALRGSLLSSNLLKSPTTIKNHELACLIERLWIFTEIGETGSGPEIDAKARDIITQFFNINQRQSRPETADMIEQSISYFHLHQSEQISIPDVAAQMGCSQTYFRRLFKIRTGRTPVEYLQEIRIRHSQSLLEHTDMAIAKIARYVGYEDPFYFSRLFSKANGASPAKYRKRQSQLGRALDNRTP